MIQEKHCRIVGGCSFLFGLVVVIASSVFLNYLLTFSHCSFSHFKKYDLDSGSDSQDIFGSGFRRKRSIYDDYDKSCSFPRLEFCAGIGITVGLLQMIISGILISSKKQKAKTNAKVWWIGHTLILLCLLIIFFVDLSYDRLKDGNYLSNKYYQKGKEIGFLVCVALDFVLLLPLILVTVFVLMKRADYNDYSPNEPEEPIVYRQQ